MTTFEITFNTRDYAIRQQLQKAILARELMYHYGFENDYFYGDSERELTRQNIIDLIPAEVREYIDEVRLTHRTPKEPQTVDSFRTAFEIYHSE